MHIEIRAESIADVHANETGPGLRVCLAGVYRESILDVVVDEFSLDEVKAWHLFRKGPPCEPQK